jgi:hypothetical protein
MVSLRCSCSRAQSPAGAPTLYRRRRLHEISLLVFRVDGPPSPTARLEPVGARRARVTVARAFNAILRREGELGCALVSSDLDLPELTQLAAKLAGGA